MAIDWLGYLFKGARPAVDFLLPRLKLERARSGSTEGYPHSFEFLAPVLDEAIQFLAHGCPPFAQSPWGWLKYRTAEPPENLRTPTARDWLAKAVVQAAAKSAIRSRVAKLPADEFDQELLQQWAIQSGEKVEASSGIVVVSPLWNVPDDLLNEATKEVDRSSLPGDEKGRNLFRNVLEGLAHLAGLKRSARLAELVAAMAVRVCTASSDPLALSDMLAAVVECVGRVSGSERTNRVDQ